MAHASSTETPVHDANRRSGKFLTCFLAGEEYGLEIRKVHEIIGTLPQNTAEVLGDVVRFCKATRRELAALGVEELDSQTRLAAVEIRLASAESLLAGIASGRTAAGTEVDS